MCKQLILFTGHSPAQNVDFEYLFTKGYSRIIVNDDRDFFRSKQLLFENNDGNTLVIGYSMGAGVVINSIPENFAGKVLLLVPCFDVGMLKGIRGFIARFIKKLNLRKRLLRKILFFLNSDSVEMVSFPLNSVLMLEGVAIISRKDEMLDNSNIKNYIPNFDIKKIEISHFDMDKLIKFAL